MEENQMPPRKATRSRRQRSKRGRSSRRCLTASTIKYVTGVYDRTLKSLRSYCVHLTGNTTDGEDLTHDSYVNFMKRVQNRGQVREETEAAFLKKIAVNQNRRTWRKNKDKATESIDQEDDGSRLAQKQAHGSLNNFKAAERESSRLDKLKEFLPIIQQ